MPRFDSRCIVCNRSVIGWCDTSVKICDSCKADTERVRRRFANLTPDRLESLPGRTRQAITMRSENRSYAEIGERLNVSPNRAQQLVENAIRDAIRYDLHKAATV